MVLVVLRANLTVLYLSTAVVEPVDRLDLERHPVDLVLISPTITYNDNLLFDARTCDVTCGILREDPVANHRVLSPFVVVVQ